MADNVSLIMTTNLGAESVGHSSSQEAPDQSVASFVISKKQISEPAAEKHSTAQKAADVGNEETKSDDELLEMNQRQRIQRRPTTNHQQLARTTRSKNRRFKLALKIVKMASAVFIAIGVVTIAYKMVDKFDRLSLVIGPTAAATDSMEKSRQQTEQPQREVKTQPMASATKATPRRSSLVKLALDQNALPICSADERLSACKLSKKSRVRLSRKNSYLAPLKFLSQSMSHGTKDVSKTENAFLRLNEGQIVISQSGEYTVRVQIVGHCAESNNLANSISMKLMVNEKTEVQVPTVCSGGDNAFQIGSSISLYLNPDDQVQVKLERVQHSQSFELEVTPMHSRTFLQISRQLYT